MASIQQAMNQMLATAGVGAGLYAHSPEGQRQAKIQEGIREIKGIQISAENQKKAWAEHYPKITKNMPYYTEVRFHEIDVNAADETVKAAQKLVEVDPSVKSYNRLYEAVSRKFQLTEAWEERLELLKTGGKK